MEKKKYISSNRQATQNNVFRKDETEEIISLKFYQFFKVKPL